MIKLYRVTLNTCVVGVMGICLADVLSCVAELWPGEQVLSAVLAPEWE